MEEILMTLVLSAIGGSVVVSGITEVVKQNSKLSGIWVIVFSLVTGIVLFGTIAVVFDLPLAESLLTGFLTGWASVGAFNSYKQSKGGI
ncbi:MAG: hypothetical protein WBA84_09845 [Carnobacterium sp.]|uniref:hypothetical protein n=1 Tax=Carnobacterium sp. TaxID=48221 RepID=UPI003C76FB7E